MIGPSHPPLSIPKGSEQEKYIAQLLQVDNGGRLKHTGLAVLGEDSMRRIYGSYHATLIVNGRADMVPTWETVDRAITDHFARESVPWPSIQDAVGDDFEPSEHALAPPASRAMQAAIAMSRDLALPPAMIVDQLYPHLRAKMAEGAEIPDGLI